MSYPSQWTPRVKSAFLTALAETGEVFAACECVNLSSQGAYRHRALDPAFAKAWDVARHQAREVVFDRLTSRALDGWQEDVFYKGQIVGTKQRHDNRLILALIGRLDKLIDGKAQARAAARGAPQFAAMLDDIVAEQPIDRHFAATRADREAIVIERLRRRADYNFYERDLSIDERDWVEGVVWVDDDEDEEEDEAPEVQARTEESRTESKQATPTDPVPLRRQGPITDTSDLPEPPAHDDSPGDGPCSEAHDSEHPSQGNSGSQEQAPPPQPDSATPRVRHSSSLLPENDEGEDSPEAIAAAKAALESAAAEAEMANDPEWQAELAKWAMIEKAIHGERTVWRQEPGRPRIRTL